MAHLTQSIQIQDQVITQLGATHFLEHVDIRFFFGLHQ